MSTEKIPIENCRLKFECRQRWDSLKVIPSCPYVATYIRRHPEDQDLISNRA